MTHLVLFDNMKVHLKYRIQLLAQARAHSLPFSRNSDRIRVGADDYYVHLYRGRRFIPVALRPDTVTSIGVDEEMHDIAETLAIFHEVRHSSAYRLHLQEEAS